MMSDVVASQQQKETGIDTDRFRLRRFVQMLASEGELDVRNEPIDLIDVAKALDGNAKAVLFRQVGPEKAEMIGNVAGSRERVALAFGVSAPELLSEILRRSNTLIPPYEVPTAKAPVHEVVLTGEQADFTRLPIHLQHANDGAPYISAGIDITQGVDRKKETLDIAA
jgi:UbiD family decarboxylase